MKIIDQQGKEHFTHEVEFSGKVVKCTPDSDHRKREYEESCGGYGGDIFVQIGWKR